MEGSEVAIVCDERLWTDLVAGANTRRPRIALMESVGRDQDSKLSFVLESDSYS